MRPKYHWILMCFWKDKVQILNTATNIVLSSLYACMANRILEYSFLKTPRKFIIAIIILLFFSKIFNTMCSHRLYMPTCPICVCINVQMYTIYTMKAHSFSFPFPTCTAYYFILTRSMGFVLGNKLYFLIFWYITC